MALLRAGAADAVARVRTRGMGEEERDEALEGRLIEAAERTAEMLGQMKGALMKIGQMVSFVDSDLVPPPYRRALEMLQADAPPMPPEVVNDVIRAELGGPPSAIFSWWSPHPMAAASIGQVHLARLGEGDDEVELAVKVQYPGVDEAIRADLANTALLSMVGTMMQRVVGDLMPRVDTRAIVAEVRDRITEELDYRNELDNQHTFADLYRGHPSINIPEVVPELSTGRVLTMQYVDAMRWAAAIQAPKEQRDAWGRTIAIFAFGSLYNHHIFNADPHPGNYLFHEDGTVTFLDFGCVKRFTPERVSVMSALVDAALACDAPALLE
ncbi:MAG TPA: AarF/ABC1/UbiB kinase family protein, partial [Acidimicrobiales bacterium]|nr:AarF/ABC1/UbiB kinase family protein [Acidimicrobiales bacterium]